MWRILFNSNSWLTIRWFCIDTSLQVSTIKSTIESAEVSLEKLFWLGYIRRANHEEHNTIVKNYNFLLSVCTYLGLSFLSFFFLLPVIYCSCNVVREWNRLDDALVFLSIPRLFYVLILLSMEMSPASRRKWLAGAKQYSSIKIYIKPCSRSGCCRWVERNG